MTNKQIEELLDHWSDCYWQSMLHAQSHRDEEDETLFRSLAFVLHQAALMLREGKYTMQAPVPVPGYEQYKYGDWPDDNL